VEAEQGYSKASREHRAIDHHVCNISKLRLMPREDANVDGHELSAQHSGDSAFRRQQRANYEDSFQVCGCIQHISCRFSNACIRD
jgi:hypothetical protein